MAFRFFVPPKGTEEEDTEIIPLEVLKSRYIDREQSQSVESKSLLANNTENSNDDVDPGCCKIC